jgi:hypothetical protein
MRMTRTTLDIDEPILKELKDLQVQEKKSLGQLATELLAEALFLRAKSRKPKKFKWISRNLKPRIDLEDKEALNRILDEDLIRKMR